MEKQVQTILKEVLSKLNVEWTDIQLITNDDEAVFMIESNEPRLLIGPHGQHLQELNFIVKRIAERATENPSPFSVDVNGYQEKQNEELRARARMFAERARSLNADVALEPMNSYARRIVHSALMNEPGVTTESDGFGKSRHIVIKPQN